MIDQKLFAKWLKLRKTSKQAIYQRIRRLREERHFAITVEEAAYMLAARDRIDIARYLGRDEYNRVRQLLGASIPIHGNAQIETVDPEEFVKSLSRRRSPNKRVIRKLRSDLSGKTVENVTGALKGLRPALADAYNQALNDIEDKKRKSYRGVANELREILREVLDILAPDSKVTSQAWFQFEGDQTRPTRRQKLRYIFTNRDGTEPETIQAGLDTVDEKLTKLTLALYNRSNRASHSARDQRELHTIVSYMNPVLLELLSISRSGRRRQ